MLPSLLLKRALDHAAVWHRDQRRKYPAADVPYMSHLAGVGILLARHGFDTEIVAAGVLHDTIEDCGVTEDALAQLFGARVARLVALVSEEDRSLPWEDRKGLYIARFATNPWDAQAITLADKIDNLWSVVRCAQDLGDPWPMFKRGKDAQIARFDALASMLAPLPPHPLIDGYREALDAVRAV